MTSALRYDGIAHIAMLNRVIDRSGLGFLPVGRNAFRGDARLASNRRSSTLSREFHSLRSFSQLIAGPFFSRVSAPSSAFRLGSVMPLSLAACSI